MDLTELSPVTDFFVITSATTNIHARAIADSIVETLKSIGIRPLHLEGYTYGNWILIDYVDIIVHIFLEDSREYYGLERLWGDAPTTSFEDPELQTSSM
jgi:ribosome-associated protein